MGTVFFFVFFGRNLNGFLILVVYPRDGNREEWPRARL